MKQRQKKKMELPGIGMRIVKSAVGVFLCYLVNMLRGGNGIVFYSQLAVLWCMQDYVSETKAKAKQRTLGTMVGALWGLLVIGLNTVVRPYFGQLEDIIYGGIVSLGIILVIYSTVLMKRKQASYFSCVVFLSIVVNHISDVNPYLFVFNRVLDTMIGIGIGVVVNCFRLPRNKHSEILFLSGLDDTLLSPNGQMSDFSKASLNRLIEDGAKFSVSTIRTPASLMEPLKGIKLKLPVIVMDGAALFNIAEKRYEYTYVISPENSVQIQQFFQQNEIPYFSNVIVDDLLMIYYQNTNHAGYNELIRKLRTSPYRNYIKRPVPKEESVVYFMILDVEEKILQVKHRMEQDEFLKRFKVIVQKSVDLEGYYLLKVYNHNACKENMMHYLEGKLKVSKIITFGTIPQRYDYCIAAGDFNKVVKLIKAEYEPLKWRACKNNKES